MFNLQGKFALITGGFSGIGLDCAKEFLRNGLAGVFLVDINQDVANTVSEELFLEFGPDKIKWTSCDITDESSFEEAFEEAISAFKHLDIVVNCAGIGEDINWKKIINVNAIALVHGTFLAMDKYLPKYKSGEEGVVVNISSIFGLDPCSFFPIYSSTKCFTVGFGRCMGESLHYERTKVRVLTICPGVTITPLLTQDSGSSTAISSGDSAKQEFAKFKIQEVHCVSTGVMEVVRSAKTGSVWIIEGGQPPKEISFPNRFERIVQ